jgi:hypothetical protein
MGPRPFPMAMLAVGYLTVLGASALAQMPGMEPPKKS